MTLLDHANLSFRVEPLAPWQGPAFEGSMLRGAMGHALRRLVCVMRRPDCTGCPLIRGCIYTQIFETPPPPGRSAGFVKPPHPFVIDANLFPTSSQRSKVDFTVRLFGKALHDAPFVVRAITEALERGLGSAQQSMRVLEPAPDLLGPLTSEGELDEIPEVALMRFHTPLRLREGGAQIDVTSLNGPVLGRAILRRVALMAEFHGRPLEDIAALRAQADQVILRSSQTNWRRLMRHSSRQKRTHSIGGLVGEAVVDFTSAPGIRDLARWVPVTHLGKGSSMGLGKIQMEAA